MEDTVSMSTAQSGPTGGLSAGLVFRVFKYSIYSLLTLNIWLFFKEDSLAAQQVFTQGVSWENVVEAYSATFDTAAWVLLLLLFELETAVIPDEWLKGRLKWLLMAFRSLGYLFILWAFWGYCVKLGVVSNLQPFAVDDACTLINTSFTYVFILDEYFAIDAAACVALNAEPLMRIGGTDIIGTLGATANMVNLAIVEVINAADWLVIVFLLEVEVLLQLYGKLSDRLVRVFKIVKSVLYSVLFGAAVFWWFQGDFLDFWDAFLWLVAFVFIEMNIFNWQAETTDEQARQESVAGA